MVEKAATVWLQFILSGSFTQPRPKHGPAERRHLTNCRGLLTKHCQKFASSSFFFLFMLFFSVHEFPSKILWDMSSWRDSVACTCCVWACYIKMAAESSSLCSKSFFPCKQKRLTENLSVKRWRQSDTVDSFMIKWKLFFSLTYGHWWELQFLPSIHPSVHPPTLPPTYLLYLASCLHIHVFFCEMFLFLQVSFRQASFSQQFELPTSSNTSPRWNVARATDSRRSMRWIGTHTTTHCSPFPCEAPSGAKWRSIERKWIIFICAFSRMYKL